MAKILVIDDDAPTRMMLGVVLKDAGHHVTLFANGRLAMDGVEQGIAFDLVVTDILMPEMDGIAVIKALQRRGAAPLILAITGATSSPSVDLLQAALNLGAQGALRKPFTNETFLEAVSGLLARPK